MAKKTSIGGQALLEGIMMRGPVKTAMAVRDPEGKIVLEEHPTKGKDRAKFFKLPVIRGVFNMIDSFTSGYQYLMRSAEICGVDAEEELPPRERPRRRPMFRRTLVNRQAHDVRPYGVDARWLLSPFYTSFPYPAISGH